MTRTSIEIRNRIGDLAKVVAEVEAFGEQSGLPQAVVNDLNVALDEVLSNVISHGFTDTADHEITIALAYDGDAVTATVNDDGVSFDPLQFERPAPEPGLADRSVGGLGIHFVRNLMDDCAYARSHGHNILTLTKRVR